MKYLKVTGIHMDDNGYVRLILADESTVDIRRNEHGVASSLVLNPPGTAPRGPDVHTLDIHKVKPVKLVTWL